MIIKKTLQATKSYYPYLALIALLLVYFLIATLAKKASSPEKQFERFQQDFLVQEKLLAEKSVEVEFILSSGNNEYWPLLERSLNSENIFAQIYQHDSLIR